MGRFPNQVYCLANPGQLMEQDRRFIPDSMGHCASNQDQEASGEGGYYKRTIVVIPIAKIIFTVGQIPQPMTITRQR